MINVVENVQQQFYMPNDVVIAGNLTVTVHNNLNSSTIEITNSFTFEGTTSDNFETTLTVIDTDRN